MAERAATDLSPTPPPRRKRSTLLKKLQRFEIGKSIESIVSHCKSDPKGQEEVGLERRGVTAQLEGRVLSRSATTTPTPPLRRRKRTTLRNKVTAQRLELEKSLDSAISLSQRPSSAQDYLDLQRLGSVSEEASLSADTTPTPPPRRKKRTLLKKLQRLELETSVDSVVSCCSIDDQTRHRQEVSRHSKQDSEPERLRGYRSRASSANDIYKISAVSVDSTSTCSFNRSASFTTVDSELESSDIFIEADSPLMMKSLAAAAGSKRNENYYSGSQIRRQSAPTDDAKKCRKTSIYKIRSVSHSPSSPEKCPSSLSPLRTRKSRSPAPPRPSSGPSKPPRPPTFTQVCSNKTAPYSQLYARTDQATATETLVIDTKSLKEKEKPKTLPRFYVKKIESQGATMQGNRDDASIAYGKRTQAALNKLVATVKLFNKGTSSSSQKTTQTAKKPPVSKTPPQRPPPAVRNTPRPPIPKSVLFGKNSTEENLYINEYDDHIYMEVGMADHNPKQQIKDSSRSGVGDEVGSEDDPYVIMNPGCDSHVYTPLDFGTRNEPKVYEALQVGGVDRDYPSPAPEDLEHHNTYVSPEELKQYEVITTLGDDRKGNEVGDSNYQRIDYDDRPYETIQYENTTVVTKSRPLPMATVTPATHRTLRHQ